ncbi:SRPBCC domain-containing protein [Maritimibacter sp. HL-12]|uniref:SRPBCC domain-containing protein n=1 Tax=Maritimibacter sp. HL-12 TaxID=1162418 RepID=UPI000A0F04C1|nr:SRPBCC domain-containing protein [Maritimibacter sp. HL-12]SMH31705.1 Uncharacterized conserved protein YndB, AHSA1/START domain [Maritimibacter sp. HL-12]
MTNAPLTIELDGETDLIVTRRFNAPPAEVYRAHTDPALVRQWMLGPPGWDMPVCEMDVRPGGAFRHEYSDGAGTGFAIVGEYISLEPGARIVHVERMLMPDPTPDNRIDTRFKPDGSGTRMVMRMSLPDSETRKSMLETGMADGMEASYANLENLDASAFAP